MTTLKLEFPFLGMDETVGTDRLEKPYRGSIVTVGGSSYYKCAVLDSHLDTNKHLME